MRSPALPSSVAAVLIAIAAVGCSSADPAPIGGNPSHGNSSNGGTTAPPTPSATATTPPSTTPPTPETSGTWSDGKQITANLDIVAGATVTIDPGATITVSPGVTITVHGTLQSSAKAKHAKLTGMGWAGIVVASGGTLSLVGVDLSGAGIQANGGDTAASYDYGTITGGAFTVDAGGKLTTDHAAVVQGGSTSVAGSFTATFLDYSGTNLSLTNAAATVSLADSKFTGGGTGSDFLTSQAGALLHMEYSTITNSHCPFHFDGLTKYTFDHVATRGNGFGLMLYNDDVGPNTITYGSFEDPSFDQTGRTTMLAIDHTYIKAKMTVGVVTIATAASGPVTAAAPRGTPGPG